MVGVLGVVEAYEGAVGVALEEVVRGDSARLDEGLRRFQDFQGVQVDEPPE